MVKRIILFLFAVLMIAVPVSASELIRIGFPAGSSGIYQDAKGNFRGHDVQYLVEMAKFLDWKLDFYRFHDQKETEAALSSGAIDLAVVTEGKDTAESDFILTVRDIGMAHHEALVVAADNEKRDYGDVSVLYDGAVGVVAGSSEWLDFLAWLRENNFTPSIRGYANENELMRALESGEVSSAVVDDPKLLAKTREIVHFVGRRRYFASTKDKAQLIHNLNLAVGWEEMTNPNFFAELAIETRDDYTAGGSIFLSPAEKAYLEELKNSGQKLKIALFADFPPFSWRDEKGEFVGIIPEYVDKIAKEYGFAIEYVPVKNQEEALEAVKSGKVDIADSYVDSSFVAYNQNLILTSPYGRFSAAKIIRKRTKEIKKVGAVDEGVIDYLKSGKEQYEYVDYDDIPAAMHGLSSGDVDAVYCDWAVAIYYLNNNRATEYQLVIFPDYTYDYAFVGNSETSRLLISILDKYIAKDKVNNVVDFFDNDRINRSLSVTEYLESVPGSTIVVSFVALALFLIILAGLSFFYRSRRDEEARRLQAQIENQNERAELKAKERAGKLQREMLAGIERNLEKPIKTLIIETKSFIDETGTQNQRVNNILDIATVISDRIWAQKTISDILQGTVKLRWDTVDTVALLDEVLQGAEKLAAQKNIELIVKREHWVKALVSVDKEKFLRVMEQILSLAIYYTPVSGRVEITAESRKSSEGRYAAWLTVKDGGRGMDEETLAKIYDVDNTGELTDMLGANQGIGIPIVSRLVNLMGGTLIIDSAVGKGTMAELEFYLEYMDE